MRIPLKSFKQSGILGVVIVSIFVVGVAILSSKKPVRLPNQIPGDVSDLDPIKDFKMRTLRSLKLKNSPGETQVSFSFPAEICNSVRELEIVLTVEGMSVNGDPVQRRYKKNCYDLDPEALSMTWMVPHGDLVVEGVEISDWTVSDLILYRDPQEKPVTMSRYEFVYVLGGPAYLSQQY